MAFSCEKCVRNLGNKDQTLADLDGSDAELGWKCLVSNKKDVLWKVKVRNRERVCFCFRSATGVQCWER